MPASSIASIPAETFEREKDISFDLVVQAIETALLTAYRHTEGAHAHARVAVDRKSGEVTLVAVTGARFSCVIVTVMTAVPSLSPLALTMLSPS